MNKIHLQISLIISSIFFVAYTVRSKTVLGESSLLSEEDKEPITNILLDHQQEKTAPPTTFKQLEQKYEANFKESSLLIDPSEQNLKDNWDLAEIDSNYEQIKELLNGEQPMGVVYHTHDSSKFIYPKQYADSEKQTDKILFLASSELVQNTIVEREEAAKSGTPSYKIEGRSKLHNPNVSSDKLPENAFEVVSYRAGTRYNGQILIPLNTNLSAALQGPNYSFDNYDYENPIEVKKHFSTIVPLGNGGILILKVKDPGILVNEDGFDLTIYQTTFRVKNTNTYFQKFAYLGLSNTPNEQDVKWFPCNPLQKVLQGCIGVVPTNEGGDKFDLSTVGLKYAKYIWIRDTNLNSSHESIWPVEGCSIDAIHLHHAYLNSQP